MRGEERIGWKAWKELKETRDDIPIGTGSKASGESTNRTLKKAALSSCCYEEHSAVQK